ncbi:MAG TPA: energy transducer TonB [Pyrinomonadaceae bacterium]|jgi:TonB family protein|nr:energy transducer TonB [Pyrinomonadaceae bacterium]
MFPKLTRRPAILSALFITSLLLTSGAAAQDKKPEPAQPPQPAPGVGRGDPTPGPTPGPDGPFRQAEVTRKAVILSKPAPGYTEEARKNNVTGAVRLRAVLDVSGQVTRISVIKPLPDGLTEKAIAAARQIKFQPAQKDGRTVSQYIVLEYNFVDVADDNEVAREAVILEKPEPEYTEEARALKVEGRVVLFVLLRKDGTAQPWSTLDGLPHGLTEKAQEAVTRIRFKPAEKDNGLPVNVIRRVEYVFSLK